MNDLYLRFAYAFFICAFNSFLVLSLSLKFSSILASSLFSLSKSSSSSFLEPSALYSCFNTGYLFINSGFAIIAVSAGSKKSSSSSKTIFSGSKSLPDSSAIFSIVPLAFSTILSL